MKIEDIIRQSVVFAISSVYGIPTYEIDEKLIQIQNTRKDFVGDITVVTFPLTRYSQETPEKTAEVIGEFLFGTTEEVKDFNVVNGFLNLCIAPNYWIEFFNVAARAKQYGHSVSHSGSDTVVIEYSSPNTNKPLHLGHIRNNLLGASLAKIINACGKNVVKVNLVNNRGIHICKSMLAWEKWGNGETPESTGMKGDHLTGKYYVIFEKEYKKEIKNMVESGIDLAIATKTAPLIKEAQAMLVKWEANNKEVRKLWKKMNGWVYEGFEYTYKKLGITFDKIYYESETYQLGKDIILDAVEERYVWLYEKEDHSIWAELSKEGLDEKLLLRADGTSVYITQDIGTAKQRFDDYNFDQHIYVVGNEQNHHFQVLKIILKRLGNKWADKLYHMAYGMVDLPSGKMKSREGTVVDADDLIAEMEKTAEETSRELGKLADFEDEEAKTIFYQIAMGALKYYILKVDPKKRILFNPAESIDFNGNTGPFIQYTYTRIQSLIRKADELEFIIPYSTNNKIEINKKEIELIKTIYQYPDVVKEAGESLSPAMIANYCYELAKLFNQFYHEFPIIKEENIEIKELRLSLSRFVGQVIKDGMNLLGIEMPERM